MNSAFGKLKYIGFKLVCEINPEISRFYRSLIPKYLPTQPQGYFPHITVVQEKFETPLNMKFWGKYEDCYVEFYYSDIIEYKYPFYFLSVESKSLEKIRLELGLENHRVGYNDFHITIARIKDR